MEIFNPNQPADRAALIEAIAQASELATALPSVKFFESGGDTSVAGVLADGLRRKLADPALPAAVVYTAENDNHAAEILHECLARKLGPDMARADARCQLLNTVIGKMSGVVTDPAQIKEQGLAPATSASTRARPRASAAANRPVSRMMKVSLSSSPAQAACMAASAPGDRRSEPVAARRPSSSIQAW